MDFALKSLDCNTTKGRIYIGTQLSCHEKLEEALKCEVIATDTTSSSDIDALIVKDKKLISLAEIKSREMSLINFENKSNRRLVYKGKEYDSYLITYEKLEKLRTLCKMLCVSGFLFVSLLESDQVVFWKICDGDGNYTSDIKREHTRTQATCNGGSIIRENAYISLKDMKLLAKPKNSGITFE
jgi:hypothetical protein